MMNGPCLSIKQESTNIVLILSTDLSLWPNLSKNVQNWILNGGKLAMMQFGLVQNLFFFYLKFKLHTVRGS